MLFGSQSQSSWSLGCCEDASPVVCEAEAEEIQPDARSLRMKCMKDHSHAHTYMHMRNVYMYICVCTCICTNTHHMHVYIYTVIYVFVCRTLGLKTISIVRSFDVRAAYFEKLFKADFRHYGSKQDALRLRMGHTFSLKLVVSGEIMHGRLTACAAASMLCHGRKGETDFRVQLGNEQNNAEAAARKA